MRGALLFILLIPTVFAEDNLIVPSLSIVAILSFFLLLFLYNKISNNTVSSRPKPPFLSNDTATNEKEEVNIEEIEKEIFAQEEFSTLHADESIKPLTKNQKHIQQLRHILNRQNQSKSQLYQSLHPTHKKHLQKSLHKVVEKYKQKHALLEEEQDKEVEKALDSFSRLKQYNQQHKQEQVAGSIDKLRTRNKKKK